MLEDVATFYVYFCNGSVRPPFWHRVFVEDGFEHCGVIAVCGPVVLKLHDVYEGSRIDWFQGATVEEVVAALKADGATILEVLVTERERCASRGIHIAIPTCVSFVKRLIGIPGIAFTPKALYAVLKSQGCREV